MSEQRTPEIAGVGTWVWYPNEGRSEWSPEARRIYGISDEGAATGDTRLFLDAVHSDDRDELIRHGWDAFRAARSCVREFRIRRREGERWVREQADVVVGADGRPSYMQGVVVDVTDQKRSEAELLEKATALQQAHELAKLGVFTIDLVSRRLYASREAGNLLGLPDAFAMGIAEFRDRFVEPTRRDEWSRRFDDAYRTGSALSTEETMLKDDGTTVRARIHFRIARDEFGGAVRAIGCIQDVTEQTLLEEQVRQTQKMQAVGQLASGLAHDFNNLLVVIGGNAQLALVRGAETVRGELEEIMHAAERAGELVRSLLTFSRSEHAEPQHVRLNDVVRTVERLLGRLLETTIEIRTELTPAEPTILADPTRLEQALLNLAVNARDAMPEGGRLTIRTEVSGESATLLVTDSGAGMNEATRARAFEPFFTTKTAGDGTGLGLSTVYATVTDLGGTIAVESTPGAGATFTISLPRVDVGAADPPTLEVRPLVEGAGERILLVEDDPMVRAVSSELLTRAGYDIDAAENGLEAIRLLEAGRSYDLIVSDLMMPKMTGLQLAEELERRGIELPIVYMSGYTEQEPEVSVERRTRFVPKPFTGEQVTAAVSELLAG